MNKVVYFKLGLMLFMQYMMYAVWWMPLAAYLRSLPNLEAWQATLILCSSAIGSMAAPLMGVVADRYFNAERLLAILNFMVGVFILLAIVLLNNPEWKFHFAGLMITVTLVMLCYMPSWGLTSTIAMTHVAPEHFPRIRMFGTIGWASAALFSLVALWVFNVEKFDGTVLPLYCGAGAALVTALLNLTLPKTPPTGARTANTSIVDIFGFRVMATLKNRNFNWFILISFLAVIPFSMYQVYGSRFFADQGVVRITATMSLGQLSELVFLIIATSILIKYGFKKALFFGLTAMLVRYSLFFASVEFGEQWFYTFAIAGILPHGLIFGLFFVAGQVYTNKLVPNEYKAQAQGFLMFVIWGAGYLVGTLLNGWLINRYDDWSTVFLTISALTVVIIVLLLKFFKNPSAEVQST